MLFRSVFHNYAMEDCKQITGASVFISGCIMISSLYLLVGHADHVGSLILLLAAFIFFIIFIMTKVCLEVAAYISSSSKRLLEALGRATVEGGGNSKKAFQKELRALRPLRVLAGSFVVVSPHTFPYLMSDIVLSNVVNLLLLS